MTRPQINVTPLIDILLVLLIIFMVVTPLKPTTFKARLPAERHVTPPVSINPDTLVVSVARTGDLALNDEPQADGAALEKRLRTLFELRLASGSVDDSAVSDSNRPFGDRTQRTVFIKAAKSVNYGSVARIIDAAKLAGAYPISLQIDDLN